MNLFGWISGLFSGGRNPIVETVEVFRPNAEREAQRGADYQASALRQFGAEFFQRKGWFASFIDALNRLPRPIMALGTIALFVSALSSPIWFAERMQGLQLVPDQLWWLMGAIVSFYFGARELSHARAGAAQKTMADMMARVPVVVENIARIRKLAFDSPGAADTGNDAEVATAAISPGRNQAVEEWAERRN